MTRLGMLGAMSGPLTFLAASPHLRGELFENAVILLLEHDEQGALGLIINLQTPQTVSELMADAPGQYEQAWLGGPVDPTLGWCLYQRSVGFEGEVELVAGLYMSSSLEVLRAVMDSKQTYMLVLGYTGWGQGQLAQEARQGVWLWVEQDTPDLLWQVAAAERWDEAFRRLGVNPGTIMPGGAQA